MGKYLNILMLMWTTNLILFVTCLFMFYYSISISAWYEGAFQTLTVSFGLSKFVLSVLLLVAVVDRFNGSNKLP